MVDVVQCPRLEGVTRIINAQFLIFLHKNIFCDTSLEPSHGDGSKEGSQQVFIIGIKHGFSCINVCQVPREMLKTEAEGGDFQQLPRDLANVNALENNV